MPKTETVHTRVTPEIKRKADAVFESIGLTTSQAIRLFLTALANHNGLPFELSLLPKEDQDLAFATNIVTVDGVPPSEAAKNIFRLYHRGYIDYETALFAIERLYK